MSSYNIKLKANPNHIKEDELDNLDNLDLNEDDEEDNEEDKEEDEEDVETEEETVDDDFRTKMREAFLKNLDKQEDNSLVFKEKVKKVRNKVKKNNIMSLKDFMTEEEKTKIKKFVSKRVEDKKKKLGLETSDNKTKRQFQPRLKPYNLVFSNNETNKKVDMNDKDEFPAL